MPETGGVPAASAVTVRMQLHRGRAALRDAMIVTEHV